MAAYRGEEVEISQPDQPTLELVVTSYRPVLAPGQPRQSGRLKGLFHLPTDDEWAAMNKEAAELTVDAPLTTDRDL